MMALSFSALSFRLVDWTRLPGPGSSRISVPSRSNHKPPEAVSCLVTIKRAPAVPKKVMVLSEELSFFMVCKYQIYLYCLQFYPIFTFDKTQTITYTTISLADRRLT